MNWLTQPFLGLLNLGCWSGENSIKGSIYWVRSFLPPTYFSWILCSLTCALVTTPNPTCPAPLRAQKSCSCALQHATRRWPVAVTEYVALKISKIIGVIARLRHFVPLYTLLNIYRSLIFPYMSYGLPAWGQAAKTIYINSLYCKNVSFV